MYSYIWRIYAVECTLLQLVDLMECWMKVLLHIPNMSPRWFQ